MKLSTEAKVGIMVTICFTIVIVVISLLAKISINKQGYNIKIFYSFLNDLREGSLIKIGGGIRIGEVVKITQTGEKTEVIAWIDKNYLLPVSSTFAIYTNGLIGEKYINVIVPPLRDNEKYLADGDVKYGIDPASFDKMMQTFQSFMQDKDGGEVLASIFQNSNKFVENLNTIATDNKDDIRTSVLMAKNAINNLSFQSKELLNQLNVLTKNMADVSQKSKEDFNIAVRNLSESTDSLNKILYRLENGKGTLGKLMTEEDIYNNLRDASIYMKDFSKILAKDPSMLIWKDQKNR